MYPQNQLGPLIGQYDRAMYGDLLRNFGPPGPMSDEYLAHITGSSVRDVRGAAHIARNDAVGTPYQVRPPKP